MGYPRGNVLDSIYALTEQGKAVTIANVMTDLELKKKVGDLFLNKCQVTKIINKENNNSASTDVEMKQAKQEEDDENNCKICFEVAMDTVIIPW